jgi:hypothetical protein
MKMFVWSDRFSFLAVAQAESVAVAREAMLLEMGESGDGSCPERDKARRIVLERSPSIWTGTNAEFAITDSAELREQVELTRTLEGDLRTAKQRLVELCGKVEAA